MKRMTSFILIIAALCVSCVKEYEMPPPVKQERDYLPKPTRTEVPSDNEGLMVLGPQLANPYTVTVMQQARARSLADDPSLTIPEIAVSHFYVRFLPANEEELNLLLQDTTINFYDYPLDREVISGTYYHDPAIADSLPTYQYASIPKQKWFSMALSSNTPSYEVLAHLFIPEEVNGFGDEDEDDDDDGGTIINPNPGWDGGTVDPIIPENPWIPAPDPGGEGEIDPNSTNTTSSNDWDTIAAILVDKAMVIAGLETEEEQELRQEMGATNSYWIPTGRITTYDNIVGGQIPLEGAKVRARVGFTTYVGYTNADGVFNCDGKFKRDAHYSIKWERAYWDIREGETKQAYYNGPKQSGNWNLNITQSTPKSLAHASIHRALHRIFYRYIGGLSRPDYNKVKVKYYHENNGLTNGFFSPHGNNPRIQIWGIGEDGNQKTPSFIFSTLCHELGGHGVHRQHCDSYSSLPLSYIESWARCVQYHMTYVEYEYLNALANLNVISPYRSYITIDHEYNFQRWNFAEHSNYDYTPIFVDIIDDYNQKQHDVENHTSNYPQDLIYYPNITTLQNIVFNSKNFSEVIDGFAGLWYNPNSSNSSINMQRFSNLVILFGSYGYETNSDYYN